MMEVNSTESFCKAKLTNVFVGFENSICEDKCEMNLKYLLILRTSDMFVSCHVTSSFLICPYASA